MIQRVHSIKDKNSINVDAILDLLLQMNHSRKIKKKNRLVSSKSKLKATKDTFTTRDSFKFEYVEAKFSQRVDRDDRAERARKREREREEREK
jgi:hypothetical protein